jgi:hypothetical protein
VSHKRKVLVIKAHGGRWGPGKVHIPWGWHNDSAVIGATLCGLSVNGEPVEAKDHEVTCLRCIAKDHP